MVVVVLMQSRELGRKVEERALGKFWRGARHVAELDSLMLKHPFSIATYRLSISASYLSNNTSWPT